MAAVTVRMYRQGLGDCFLLTFPTNDPKQPCYMLIDCGVVKNHKDKQSRRKCPSLTQVAQDIYTTTGGSLDVLVITHEHWDHVSGFGQPQSRAIFEKLKVKQIWLAWTENPHDNDAKALKAKLHKDHQALQMALSRANSRASKNIASMLELFGADVTEQAMDAARALVKPKQDACYVDPAELDKPLTLAGVPGVRIYALGPPREEKSIRKMNPGKGQEYLATQAAAAGLSLSPSQAFLMGAYSAAPSKLPDEDKELFQLSFPFDRNLRMSRAEAEGSPFFNSHYYRSDEWRRIDGDWLQAGEELSLDLGTYTNNTSLTFAIELVKSGKVLLFAADAQIGNWMSWKDSWKVTSGGVEETVELKDLLKRAVVYKVGHHGSHNASYKPHVDLMTSPSLVSMLPFDDTDAKASGWPKMLSARLVKWLSGQDENGSAKRVVVRLDQSPTAKPKGIKPVDWKAFKSNYEENDLYMQYTLTD